MGNIPKQEPRQVQLSYQETSTMRATDVHLSKMSFSEGKLRCDANNPIVNICTNKVSDQIATYCSDPTC